MVFGLSDPHLKGVGRRRDKGWLLAVAFVILLVAASVIGSVYVNDHKSPRSYLSDTDFTLKYNGSLWGNGHVNVDANGITADFSRLDSLATNPPFPPYYNVADNEKVVRVGDLAFGHCRGDNQIPEVPITTVHCDLVTVSGAFDGMYTRP